MNEIKKIVYQEADYYNPFSKVKDNAGAMNYIKYKDDNNIASLDRLVGRIKPEIEELILNADFFGDIRENCYTIRFFVGKKEVRLVIPGDDINAANKGKNNEQ